MILTVLLSFLVLYEQVHCDATIAFPLLVAETFAKNAKKPLKTEA